MATVVIWPRVNQSAKASRVAVEAAKQRTGWGASLGGSATEWASAPTSMPAAWRGAAANGGGSVVVERACFCLRGAMVISTIAGGGHPGSGCGRDGLAARFQTGPGQSLSPRLAPRAPGTSLPHGHKAPLARTASHDPLRPEEYSADSGLVPSRWTAAQQCKSLL